MVLTVDKGVSLVVMNKEDYIKKAEDLLNQPTYRSIPSDPTTRYKNKLKPCRKPSRQNVGSIRLSTEGFTPQGKDPPNSMGY